MERYGLGLTIALALVLALVFSFGCTQPNETTIGNGKVDPVEAATVRVAVGMAFTARPDTVAPAYAVSDALLTMLDASRDQSALVTTINQTLAGETAKLNLDAGTAASFADLVALVEAQIVARLAEANITASQRMVVVRDIVAIVHDTAAMRMAGTVRQDK